MSQVERYRAKLVELEQTVDRLTTELQAAEIKRKEAENHLMVEQSSWKTERSALEDKLKKVLRRFPCEFSFLLIKAICLH